MDDNTAQFVCDLNVKRFVEKLRSERDPDMRMSLKKVLVEEEDKFGRSTERVRNVERYIAKGSRRIASQKESLVERLKANGRDIRLAERTLNNLVEIQRLFQQYCHRHASS
jgi:hypothetical protein